MDPRIQLIVTLKSITSQKDPQGLAFDTKKGRFDVLREGQSIENVDQAITHIRQNAQSIIDRIKKRELDDSEVDFLYSSFKIAKKTISNWSKVDKVSVQKLNVEFQSLENDIQQARQPQKTSLKQITVEDAQKIARDAEKVFQYVNQNKTALLENLELQKSVYRREETKLPATIQLILPDKEEVEPQELVVILHPKPEKPIVYKGKKRMVNPKGIGGFKLIKLSVEYQLVEKPKLTYLATATPRGYQKDGRYDKKLYEAAVQKLSWEHFILSRLGGVRGVIEVKKPLFMYSIKKGKPLEGLEKPNMVMAYAESDLDDVLKNGRLQEDIRRNWTLDILAGLMAVHEGIDDETDQRIVLIHNDLKPENILIVNGEAKLADFGLTISRNEENPLKKVSGTPLWFSPEKHEAKAAEKTFILKKSKINRDALFAKAAIVGTPADVFALGLILYQMKHGEEPSYFKQLTSRYYGRNATIIRRWFNRFQPVDKEDEIIKKMLAPDPKARLEAKKALEEFEKYYENS